MRCAALNFCARGWAWMADYEYIGMCMRPDEQRSAPMFMSWSDCTASTPRLASVLVLVLRRRDSKRRGHCHSSSSCHSSRLREHPMRGSRRRGRGAALNAQRCRRGAALRLRPRRCSSAAPTIWRHMRLCEFPGLECRGRGCGPLNALIAQPSCRVPPRLRPRGRGDHAFQQRAGGHRPSLEPSL